MDFAIPTEGLETPQLLFLMSVYGYILATASNYLATGAELLLEALGPSWAGIIGGGLIPILGVVPDSLMVIMSGLGPIESVSEELKVGVGTLVGSTIMLLTIPTAVGVYLSRRKLGGREMRALKKEKQVERKVLNTVTGEIEPKTFSLYTPVVPKSLPLFDRKTWFEVGGTALSSTPKYAKVMMLTSLTYFIIQIPAIIWGTHDDAVSHEHYFAGIGFVIACCTFLWYLYFTYSDEDSLEVISEKQRSFAESWHLVNGLDNIKRVLKSTADPFLQAEALYELFDVNNSGSIEFEEMVEGWKKIGYEFDDDQARMSFNMLDYNKDGSISRQEFFNWIEDYLLPQYIASQPFQLPSNVTIPTNPSTEDILNLFPLPTVLKQFTADKVTSFLSNKNESSLSLILNKEERYALHIWFSSIQSISTVAFTTHCQDVNNTTFASTTMDPETSSMASTTGVKKSKPHTSHFPRQFTVDKLEKTSIKSTHNLRPKLRPLVSGVQAWACASESLIAFYKATNDPWETLFKSVANMKNTVDLEQFQTFATKYSLGLRGTQVKFLFYSHDTDMDHSLSEEQFKLMLESLVNCSGDDAHSYTMSQIQKGSGFGQELESKAFNTNTGKNNYSALSSEDIDNDDEDGDEHDDEEESEFGHLSSSQLLKMSVLYIICGAFVVTVFSDPTVDVIGALGNKCGIPAFYLSFIFTPIFSNSSEIFASLKFAAKKTDVSLGLTLSSLYGAATMNNSCLLAVFLSLIFFRGIPWTATVEVSVMLAVMYTVGILGLTQTIPLWKAGVTITLFPLSILAIYVLNTYM